ncbi:MAG: acyl-CoA dehydrogenase [Phycisphaerae bacterium]|jgi:alkylation response protein AidB-like acyl-CoA dehydrogenase|nr:MAG: acyl-CoA dehydrogenase [Phycisphaerae bacterium]
MVEFPAFVRPLLTEIARRAVEYDIHHRWPEQDLVELSRIGAMKWAIGKPWGGYDLDALTLHDHYEAIASASLATALILSQRDAAIGYIEASENPTLKDRYLPLLSQNKLWCTIGISHLSTSHQSGTLTAERDGNRFIINGTIPWATGAVRSDFLVAGAKTLDQQQILFILPTTSSNVQVLEPTQLATLSAAQTSTVRCANVCLEPEQILVGPIDKALHVRKRRLPLGQTFAPLGLTLAALDLIRQIDLPSAKNTYESLLDQFNELRHTVREANTRLMDEQDLQSGPLIRSECNNLAIRATHSAVTLYKGAGLRIDHPAQRLAREALFLLVWSTPTSVMDRNLELIADPY